MLHVKNHKQKELFDPWRFLGPKRRKRLDQSWPGFFRSEILDELPVTAIAPYFDKGFGRPTKEMHTMLGTLLLQQMLNLTDEETVDQLAFSIQWHYALNISEETDSSKYICPKTLWNIRNIATENNIDTEMFRGITDKLAKIFNVNTENQRLDSVHLKSNMRRLGRISIISTTIHTFLNNLKRQHREAFDSIDTDLVEQYTSPKALACFSMVKPSDSDKTLQSVSQDLYELVHRFKRNKAVLKMRSYGLLSRVLDEQCAIRLSENDQQVRVVPKNPKEVPSHSLQNPSDPEASFCSHKGQGYKAQVMETYTTTEDKDAKAKELNLITHIQVETACQGDAHALKPAIESTQDRGLGPREVQADTLYGGDENWVEAKSKGVDLVSPVKTPPKSTSVKFSFFSFSEEGHITSCPQGEKPLVSIKRKTRYTQRFSLDTCTACPRKEECPGNALQTYYVIRYDDRTFRLSRRMAFEQTGQFREKYRWRAGVEATMSEFNKRTGVKKLRVRGFKAVRFAVVLKAIGVNLFRATAVRMAESMPKSILTRLVFSIFNPFAIFKERFVNKDPCILQYCINNFTYYKYATY